MNFIHKAVLKTKTDEFFVSLRRSSGFIRKLIPTAFRHRFTSFGRFVPPSSAYPRNDSHFLTREGAHFHINRSDYVQWRLFYGVRDNALAEAKKHINSNTIVLDIGSSFGAFSLRLAAYISKKKFTNIQVHGFEPNPTVIEWFKINLSLNPQLKNILRLHPVGLGNKSGEHSFHFEETNTGAARVLPDETTGQFKVDIRKLDDIVDAWNPEKIAFIKLIAGGSEPDIFTGGWNTITKYKPPVFFEVTPLWWVQNNATLESVLTNLQEIGYRFMIEHHNEMLPYEFSKFSGKTQFNLLATI